MAILFSEHTNPEYERRCQEWEDGKPSRVRWAVSPATDEQIDKLSNDLPSSPEPGSYAIWCMSLINRITDLQHEMEMLRAGDKCPR